MPFAPINITMHWEKPPEMAPRVWREGMRAAFDTEGRAWHSQFLPKHFQPDARDRYHFQRRGEKYQKYKELASRGVGPYRYQGPVLEGGKTDLVFTGLLRRTMTEPARIRAYPTRVTVTMIGPRYITMKPYKSRQPDKAAEVIQVLQSEQRALDSVLGKAVHERFRTAPFPPKVVKIGK